MYDATPFLLEIPLLTQVVRVRYLNRALSYIPL